MFRECILFERTYKLQTTNQCESILLTIVLEIKYQ